jgi:hypothetical protein
MSTKASPCELSAGQTTFRSVVPAQAGTHARGRQGLRFLTAWIPAFAGMTGHPSALGVRCEAYL